MKKGITLKDIARRLNMSVSTVSKALSGNITISEATKERVQKLAGEWNYIPNEAARHFKLNKTFTIGLIIPVMLDQYYVLAINGAEKVAVMEQYNVIISQSHEDPANEEKILDLMKRHRVDGLIIAITKNTRDTSPFHKLKYLGIPIVFIARTPKDDAFNYVSSNNAEGAFKATAYLVKKGHQRIAHLMGPETITASHSRLQGYKEALQKHNLPFDAGLLQVVDLTEQSTFAAMRRFMKMKSPPTAVFTFKNYISLDAIEYLKREHPQQLGTMDFVGFGNLPLFQYLDHKPTASIDENSYEIGVAAARLLFQVIKEENDPPVAQHIQIPCKLVVHK